LIECELSEEVSLVDDYVREGKLTVLEDTGVSFQIDLVAPLMPVHFDELQKLRSEQK
jgi:hypothetical protein